MEHREHAENDRVDEAGAVHEEKTFCNQPSSIKIFGRSIMKAIGEEVNTLLAAIVEIAELMETNSENVVKLKNIVDMFQN